MADSGEREKETAEVSATDARNRLGELIDRTLGGERIALVRYGKRIAVLVPIRDLATLESVAA